MPMMKMKFYYNLELQKTDDTDYTTDSEED